MDIARLREVRLAHPFKPFNLLLEDGRKLPVEKPYFLGISPTQRFVTHSSVDGGFEVIRLNQVREIEIEINHQSTSGHQS